MQRNNSEAFFAGIFTSKTVPQSAPKHAIFTQKIEKFSGEGAQPPHQTPLPAGGGHPLPHPPTAPQPTCLRRSTLGPPFTKCQIRHCTAVLVDYHRKLVAKFVCDTQATVFLTYQLRKHFSSCNDLQRLLKVINKVIVRQITCDFLLAFHSNCVPIQPDIYKFFLPHLYMCPYCGRPNQTFTIIFHVGKQQSVVQLRLNDGFRCWHFIFITATHPSCHCS